MWLLWWTLSQANGAARLLFEYPEPVRSEILDLFFLPGAGTQWQGLKVEIGGDVESSYGAAGCKLSSNFYFSSVAPFLVFGAVSCLSCHFLSVASSLVCRVMPCLSCHFLSVVPSLVCGAIPCLSCHALSVAPSLVCGTISCLWRHGDGFELSYSQHESILMMLRQANLHP